ncbi:MAG: retroviral-like aspartic protease family protein [Maricaulis sp.]|nr:retroviral-like aspartic protease family protein [Maricaulis sp.]
MKYSIRNIALAGGVMLALMADAPAQAQIVAEAELTRGSKGHFLTEMMINGQGPYTVLVDTAASATFLMQTTAGALGLTETGGHGGMAQTATGQVEITLYNLESLVFDDLDFGAVRVVGAPADHPDLAMDGVDAIIGADLLGDYLLEFDQSNGQIRLHESAAELTSNMDDWIEVPVRSGIAGLLFTEVTVNEANVAALIDTGASRVIVNMSTAQVAGYRHGDPRASMDDPLIGFGGTQSQAFKVTGADLEWGDLIREDQTITISETPVFDAIGLSDGPAMIAGAPLFGQRDFVIDYTRMAVWISPLEVQ